MIRRMMLTLTALLVAFGAFGSGWAEGEFRLEAGQYKVGTDIAEGGYSLSAVGEDKVFIYLWGEEPENYSAGGGLLRELSLRADANPRIGKLNLKAGNALVLDGPVDFGDPVTPVFNENGWGELLPGEYRVGVDLPAGDYTVLIGEGTQYGTSPFELWGAEAKDSATAGGGLLLTTLDEQVNRAVGRLVLREGNLVCFEAPLAFGPYQRQELDFDDGVELYPGEYRVGEDLPAGLYAVSMDKTGSRGLAHLDVWGAAVGDFKTARGWLRTVSLTGPDRTRLDDLTLSEGNVMVINGLLTFTRIG